MKRIVIILLCICSIHISHASLKDTLEHITATGGAKEQLAVYKQLAALTGTKDFEQSIVYGTKGLAIAKRMGDSVSIGELKNLIGSALYFKGNFDLAANNYYQAIGIFERHNEQLHLANAFNNLAKLYRKTRELDKAEEYYDNAMRIFKVLGNKGGMEMIWNESGVVFEYRGDYEEAIKRYSKALTIAKETGNEIGVSYAYNNLAGSYALLQNFETSEKYLLEALNVRKKLNDSFSLAINYSDLGALYDSMKLYPKAIEAITESNHIANKLSYPELIAHNYKLLSHIYHQNGEPEKAYTNYILSDNIYDSLLNLEKSAQIEELNTKYQTEKKEQQIALQQLEISHRNYIIIAIILILILAVLLAYSYYNRYKTKQEQKLQQEIINQQKLATQAVLEAEEKERARIGQDLHDGVGQIMSAVKINLSTIQSSISFHDEKETVKFENILSLVDESCKEVRSISHTMMPNALLRSGLSSAIRGFINKIDNNIIETNLYTEGLDKRLNTDVETILYRVIQECVNNVIKHAKASRLDISIIKEDHEITATVEDDGIGFDTTDTNNTKGIGLKNIITRIQYLKGTVVYDSQPGKGTLIIINLPYNN